MLQHSLYNLNELSHAVLIYKDQSISINQIIHTSLAIHNIFKSHLISQETIAFYLPNSPRLLAWQLLCFHLGIPIVPIIYEHDADFVDKVLSLTAPKILITTTEKKDIIKNKTTSIVIDDEKFCVPIQSKSYIEPSSAKNNELCMIIFSSGTSGVMKGIMHSYQSAYGFMQTLEEVLAINHRLTYLIAQPMGHIGGIITTLLTLLNDGTAILLEQFEIHEYMQTIKKYKPTHLNLHTPLFYQIINFPNIDKGDFKQIKTAFGAGDTMPVDLAADFFQVTGAKMQTGYGMTETGIVTLNTNPYGKYAGSCGKKINRAEIEIRNTAGEKLATNCPGEMWVKSPGNCLGYFKLPELNANTIQNGWFRTHDIGSVDQDGFYWYFGRDNQVININNHEIYLDKIEQQFFACPIVSVAAVIVSDTITPQIILFIESSQAMDKKLIQEKVMQFAEETLEAYELPNQIIVLDKIPLNSTGKIDRVGLKHIYIEKFIDS